MFNCLQLFIGFVMLNFGAAGHILAFSFCLTSLLFQSYLWVRTFGIAEAEF